MTKDEALEVVIDYLNKPNELRISSEVRSDWERILGRALPNDFTAVDGVEVSLIVLTRRLLDLQQEVRAFEERGGLRSTIDFGPTIRKVRHAVLRDLASVRSMDPRDPGVVRGTARLRDVGRSLRMFVDETRRLIGLPPEPQEELDWRLRVAFETWELPEGRDFFRTFGGPLFEIGCVVDGSWPIVRGETIGMRRGFSGLVSGWSDEDLMGFGLMLWEDTYRKDPAGAPHLIEEGVARLYKGASMTKRRCALAFARFAALWAHQAFQKIVTTHTFAAALMCSDASRESLEDLPVPWRAFMIVVPDGLLAFESGATGVKVDLRRILVTLAEDGSANLAAYDPSERGNDATSAVFSQSAPTMAELLFDGDEPELVGEGVSADGPEARALKMAKRLVVGLLMTLAYTDNLRRSKASTNGRTRTDSSGREEPQHRTTFVGKPLKIDLRDKVRSFLGKPTGGAYRAPSVQVLVRGHYKRQVVGVGRSGRKVIWIEPYWKGDPEAPILSRPRRVGT